MCRLSKNTNLANPNQSATVTNEFLDFSASRGNNLRSIGLTGGCKWCLCAGRWKEALEFSRSEEGKGKPRVVPKVKLDATHERALDVLKMEDLKAFSDSAAGEREL